MRATSVRRAPQRHILDRTLGETRALAPGACPHCFREISLTTSGRRRHHRDEYGTPCTGGGILVESHAVQLDALPDVVIPRRGPILRPRALTVDGHPYVGRSDREPAHGRATCDGCGRQLPLNGDGTIRRHRVRHQDPLAPHCGGAK